jgi:hypothetical protein
MENTNDLLIDNYLGNYLIGGVRVILWQCVRITQN